MFHCSFKSKDNGAMGRKVLFLSPRRDVLDTVPQLTGFVSADVVGRTAWQREASMALMTALMSRTPAGLFLQMGSSSGSSGVSE